MLVGKVSGKVRHRERRTERPKSTSGANDSEIRPIGLKQERGDKSASPSLLIPALRPPLNQAVNRRPQNSNQRMMGPADGRRARSLRETHEKAYDNNPAMVIPQLGMPRGNLCRRLRNNHNRKRRHRQARKWVF